MKHILVTDSDIVWFDRRLLAEYSAGEVDSPASNSCSRRMDFRLPSSRFDDCWKVSFSFTECLSSTPKWDLRIEEFRSFISLNDHLLLELQNAAGSSGDILGTGVYKCHPRRLLFEVFNVSSDASQVMK